MKDDKTDWRCMELMTATELTAVFYDPQMGVLEVRSRQGNVILRKGCSDFNDLVLAVRVAGALEQPYEQGY